MEFIEISAKTVDDAITKACIEMETSSDNLEIEVVREGSSGFFGLGSKPAVIKVRRKENKPVEEPVKKAVEKPVEKKQEAKPAVEAPKRQETSKKENAQPTEKKPEKRTQEKKQEKQPEKKKKPAQEKRSHEYVVVDRSEEEIAAMKKNALEFLEGVFKAMELPVTIGIEYEKETGNLNIDFSGEDMGILIGKRGQTLDSLQYLTSLVVNKGQEHYIRIKLDTENYRNRRKDTLENLARNIAYKVRKTRKPVSLEPMNPYERRIIHSSLQGNKYVETYSEGNEPYRHVVVTLKKDR